jgi:hypothetical protein
MNASATPIKFFVKLGFRMPPSARIGSGEVVQE